MTKLNLHIAGLVLFATMNLGSLMTLQAENTADLQNQEYRETVFHLGLNVSQFALMGKNHNKVLGNSVVVNLGGGFIKHRYFSLSAMDIILGPYQPLDDLESRLDYSGTGLSHTMGWTWNRDGLRVPHGTFGILASIRYVDIVGRSVGTRTLESGAIRDMVNQIYDFSFMPGLFYAFLSPPRPKGHKPELLETKLEGAIIFFGVAYPIKSDFSQEFLQTTGSESTKIRYKGTLKGRTYLIGIITPFGV